MFFFFSSLFMVDRWCKEKQGWLGNGCKKGGGECSSWELICWIKPCALEEGSGGGGW